MNFLETVNWESTVHDYEFTRQAHRQIMDVVSNESFEDMSSEEVFRFLFQEISLVSFKDYLKRYLYERAGITEPFREIDDSVWQEIIINAFEENNAPHSFEPTSTRWNTTVKSWLTSDRVRRNTVFLLGFGLKMTEEDASDFLTKVLEEDSYHMDDPMEVIYRYCFRHGLCYAQAVQLKEKAKSYPSKAFASDNEDAILRNESSLLGYITGLPEQKEHDRQRETIARLFEMYYDESRIIIARIYQADEEEKPEKERKQWTAADITAADLEKMLCSGIPTTDSGNLVKSGKSLLSRHFQNYRLSRQRTDGLLKRQLQPDRYDLITILFFLHAQKEDLTGEERLTGFLQQVNPLLESCGMYRIHAANPYEAFIMICILSDCPLAVYGDIWEMSYVGEDLAGL